MPDVVYPLCEPSDDGGMCPLTDDGDRVELWGEWLRAFCKVKTIWEEIFSNAGFTVTGGEVISSDIFDRLYMPISSLKITNTEKYMYSVWWSGSRSVVVNEILAFPGAILINGDASFQGGYYICPFTATYTIRVMVLVGSTPVAPTLTLWKWFATNLGEIPMVNAGLALWEYQIEQTATVGDILFIVTGNYFYSYYSVEIIKIDNPSVGFGSTVDCRNLLPAMTQTDFIKLICNVFALVPEVNARDHTVRFWNYQELYDNIPYARDWSKYLSERDDEVEFKFGDYAQENILKYNDSDDVQPSKGKGIMPIDDETLPEEKDLVELSVSTADEVRILLNVFPVDVARIAFNKYDAQDSVYKPNDSIDPRIVYVDRVPSVASPAYEKTLGITYTDPIFGETTIDITSPLKASTLTLSFSNLIIYYANISRMLTRTKLRRAKFNLPVYEVAGLRHNIPIYLSQYKAYFYVNKISNYVAGRLCTIDLIRL